MEKHTDLNVVMINGTIKDDVKAKALNDIEHVPGTVLIAQSSMSAGWQTLISSATIFASVTQWRHYHQGMGRNLRHENRTEEKKVYCLYLGPVSERYWEQVISDREKFNQSLR